MRSSSCVPALAGFYVSKEPKEFEAHTTLVIDSSVPQYLGQNFRDVIDVSSNWWSSQETMQTELRVVGSYSQAVAVAQALCVPPREGVPPLMQRFDPSVSCDKKLDMERAAVALQALVRLEPIKDSRIVSLSIVVNDAALSARAWLEH